MIPDNSVQCEIQKNHLPKQLLLLNDYNQCVSQILPKRASKTDIIDYINP